MIKRLERFKNTVNKYMADVRPDRLTTCQLERKSVVNRRPSVYNCKNATSWKKIKSFYYIGTKSLGKMTQWDVSYETLRITLSYYFLQLIKGTKKYGSLLDEF
jgi:hypothetical protein